ncbi:MAG: DUF4166 domain-containing protein [Elstera sp.]
MTASRRVVIIGGTGVFGKRLARHIAQWPGLEIMLTSRDAAKAQALAAQIASEVPGARISGVALDHRQGVQDRLSALAPWAVIDASGPFQGADYATATAALRAGAHVLDLADAREYLAGYGTALNGLALERGLVALAGASSTPALSGAVVAALTQGWTRVDTIDIAITPGGQSEVGPAVIEAILTYAGKPIPAWRKGALAESYGWGEGHWVAMPGLGRRLVAAVETLDAQYLGPRYKVQSRVRFSAGLESLPEQLGLMALARFRRWGLFKSVKTWVPWLLRGRQLTRLITSDRGGMLVDITGLDAEGRAMRARWSLLVGQNHGPNIPTLPAAAALKILLTGTLPPGARAATEALPLAAIEAEMAPYAIRVTRDTPMRLTSPVAKALGAEGMARLPSPLQAFHADTGPRLWEGRASVVTGASPVARLIARVLKLPAAGEDIPVTVDVEDITPPGGPSAQRWGRTFAGRRFHSILDVSPSGTLCERFGGLRFHLGLAPSVEALALTVTGWDFYGLPLPISLAPRADAYESVDARGRFYADIRLTLPGISLLVHYRTWLTPKSP